MYLSPAKFKASLGYAIQGGLFEEVWRQGFQVGSGDDRLFYLRQLAAQITTTFGV